MDVKKIVFNNTLIKQSDAEPCCLITLNISLIMRIIQFFLEINVIIAPRESNF